jgi:hypothetical protein
VSAVESRVFPAGPDTDHPIIPDAWGRPTRPEVPRETSVALEADPAVEAQETPWEIEETYVTIRDHQPYQRTVTAIEKETTAW